MAVKFVTTSEVALEGREEAQSGVADTSTSAAFSLHCSATETVFTNRRFPGAKTEGRV